MTSDRGDYFVPLSAFSAAEIAAWERLQAEHAETVFKARTKELQIPEVRFQPTDDDVVVFRLEAKEKTTEGGVILPNQRFVRDQDERTMQETNRLESVVLNCGVLLNAGCSARDWLRSHGYLIGDIVRWGRYSGEEESVFWFTGGAASSAKDILQINVRDLRGSFDLYGRLHEQATMRLVFVADPEGRGMHLVKPTVKEK